MKFCPCIIPVLIYKACILHRPSCGCNLHKVRLDFCQKQYVGNYGFENPRISQLLTELKEDPRYFIGYKSYDKYLAEENPITVGE